MEVGRVSVEVGTGRTLTASQCTKSDEAHRLDTLRDVLFYRSARLRRVTRATIAEQLELAKRGEHPRLVCRVPSGWLFLGRYQFLPGYCVLAADPPADGLNALTGEARARFLADMGRVGDALLKTTDAVRINYAILGNGDPALHAHLQPQYADEKEPYRSGPVDLYPPSRLEAVPFNLERDQPLMQALRRELEQTGF